MKTLSLISRFALLALSAGLLSSLRAADAAPAAKTAPATPAASAAPAALVTVQGRWTAEFETQVGVQKYTYEFKVEGTKLTGTAEGSLFEGKVAIEDGKLEGNKITFSEKQDFGGMALDIKYTGEIKGDEIAFKREVGELATEELVAKRAKPEAAAAAAPAKKN